jgi:hypothetical protein
MRHRPPSTWQGVATRRDIHCQLPQHTCEFHISSCVSVSVKRMVCLDTEDDVPFQCLYMPSLSSPTSPQGSLTPEWHPEGSRQIPVIPYPSAVTPGSIPGSCDSRNVYQLLFSSVQPCVLKDMRHDATPPPCRR